MTRAAVSYKIPLPGAVGQGTASADRYLCSLIAAAASWLNGCPLGGDLRGLPPADAGYALRCAALSEDITADQFELWVRAVAGGARIPKHQVPLFIGELTIDEYQRDAVASMYPAGGVLALGCGLGKTVTAAAAARAVRDDSFVRGARCWIVCPVNAMGAWKRYVPYLRSQYEDVQILSMDSIFKIADALDNRGGLVIFDEAHLLGAMSARRTKAAHKLRLKFDAGLCLTGTLLHGGIEKALSVLDLAVPGAALFSSRWKAGDHFKCLVKKRIGTRTVTALEKPTGVKREQFLEYLSRFVVSLTKDSPAVASAVTIPEQLLQTVDIGDCSIPLEQLAANYVLEKLDETPGEIVTAAETAHALCREGADAKLNWLLEQMGDDLAPVVVFAHYTETLDAAAVALAANGISFVRIDGSTSAKDRQQAQARFQAGEVRVFLGQLTAAGISMDLFRADVSVTLDVNWKAADYSQALARTCRRGQAHVCHHFDLVTNVLQKRIVQRLRDAQDFDASLSDWQRIKGAI